MQIQNLIGILFLLFLIGGCHAENNDPLPTKKEKNIAKEFLNEIILDRAEIGLEGNVRSTMEYEFSSGKQNAEITNIKGEKYHFISADSLIKSLKNIELEASKFYLFNRYGRLIKDIRYVIHNKTFLENVEKYDFDKNGKLLEWSKTDIDKELAAQKTFVYDHQERLVEFMESYPFDKSIRKINATYKKDTIILEEVNTLRGGITSSWKIKYDKYGSVIENNPRENKQYDKKGNLIKLIYKRSNDFSSRFSITYDYDYKGNRIKETEYDSVDKVISTKQYYYNEKNELIQSIEIDTSATEVKRYNEHKYVYEYTSTPLSDNNRSFYSYWVNHDKYGNVIKQVVLNRNDNGKLVEEIIKTELTYDKFGNWVTKHVFENDSLTTIFERQIKYF